MIAFIDAALSYGLCAGALFMFVAFVIGIASGEYFTMRSCGAVISFGFVLAAFCGLPLLILRHFA
jgi:hypothetical protein